MKTLVIGSTVCDVVIYLDKLPTRQGDEHIHKQFWNLGGCAFNVAHLLHQLDLSYTFLSPIGSGHYGAFVKAELEKIGMASPIQSDLPNGCCYCFVEEDGERTFLSEHGVEYTFQKEWLDGLDLDEYDFIYVCGLEVEEETGQELVEALATVRGQLIFAPGPRGHLIPQERLKTLYSYAPILHLNEQEVLSLSGKEKSSSAISHLQKQTQNLIIVTEGDKGARLYEGEQMNERPAYQSAVKDTIGAGDSHVAAFVAGLMAGKTKADALDFANLVSSKVVAVSGVQLGQGTYEELKEKLKYD